MKEILMTIGILAFAIIAVNFVSKKVKATTATGDLATLPQGALYPVVIKNKWGYINSKLQVQIAPQFATAGDFNEGLAPVSNETKTPDNTTRELYGYIDSNGSVIVTCRYDRAYPFYEGYAVVVRDGKYGFIDKTGKEIIPCTYEDASRFSEGLACVKVNGKNGFIDRAGKMVIAPTYQRACWVSDFSEGLAAVYMDENSTGGYIDKTGKWIVPPGYSYVSRFSEGLAIVQSQNSPAHGFINHKGEMVIAPVYHGGLGFHEGVATVKTIKKDGTAVFAIIDKTGKKTGPDLPYLFTGIFCEGLAGVENSNHRWGFIDKTGTEVIAPQFAGVALFHNGLARMQTGSLFSGLKTVYINKKGTVVWKE